ncbi:MAG: WYL domain-containing protein [Bacteroidales bacterium]|nr:WYL domain-containing protein [Bacteroidales bacterium]
MTDNDREPSLISKYVWLIETIYRAGRISLKGINERWCRDVNMSGGEAIPARTFNNWRYAIHDLFGLDIENERCGEYRYFIENEEDISRNGLRSWLYNTLCVSNALAGSQAIKDRILLEYVPSGQQHLNAIIEAMKANRVISITHYNYWRDDERSFDLQPYCVKLFRQRWYVVAKSTDPAYREYAPWVFSLDRIRQLTVKDETFTMPNDWDAQDYFDGCFGVIPERDTPKQLVKLKVTAGQANYIRDLRLHESQKELERNEDYSIFLYHIRPTFDFVQELLHNGESIEVLEPADLRSQIAGIVERMHEKYKRTSE